MALEAVHVALGTQRVGLAEAVAHLFEEGQGAGIDGQRLVVLLAKGQHVALGLERVGLAEAGADALRRRGPGREPVTTASVVVVAQRIVPTNGVAHEQAGQVVVSGRSLRQPVQGIRHLVPGQGSGVGHAAFIERVIIPRHDLGVVRGVTQFGGAEDTGLTGAAAGSLGQRLVQG